ncbi:MAG TPA: DUF2199 domain-containing protein [Terracidiphilus sp.]|nr:DUF2199 domain-containing protein [Terracidiphilus sp.]
MSETVQCSTHGESQKAFVCKHLVGENFGLGFNRNDPNDDNPFPDAWCDACEGCRMEYGGWTEESEKHIGISLICSNCYRRALLCNQKTTVTLDELACLRWKCSSCDEWHTGPMLDVGSDWPSYWSSNNDSGRRWVFDESGNRIDGTPTFLDSDYCAVDDEYFFVRGLIHLPIIGAGEAFRFGIWGSLSRTNFEALIRADAAGEQPEFEPMFSWLSTRLELYPDTDEGLKMYAHIQEPGMRPHFHLEPTDHPLARDYHEGITVERLKEIMFTYLPPQQV